MESVQGFSEITQELNVLQISVQKIESQGGLVLKTFAFKDL